jgi:lipoprotein-anchoring transpeptidase ErfK/SrfK
MRHFILLGTAALLGFQPLGALAQDRYRERPPVVVSPDLAAPWVMQLQRAPVERRERREAIRQEVHAPRGYVVRPAEEPRRVIRQRERVYREPAPEPIRTAAIAGAGRNMAKQELAPQFLPQTVAYDGNHAAGTIVIDTNQKFLYLVEADGQAKRYGVGVGKEGFGWSGTETITNKREWPTWTPPAEMREREAAKGKILPVRMEGGPANPLGARALYLGDTLYRIHGTNAPWTIGTNVSSGCIRMRNEDVIDLYERVTIGAKVVVM